MPNGATMPWALKASVTVVDVGAAHVPPQVTVMLTSPLTAGLCVSCVAVELDAHRGAGLTVTRGAAPDTAFSIGVGDPDSQYTVGESWTTSFVSMDAMRAPAVAPSCNDAF